MEATKVGNYKVILKKGTNGYQQITGIFDPNGNSLRRIQNASIKYDTQSMIPMLNVDIFGVDIEVEK